MNTLYRQINWSPRRTNTLIGVRGSWTLAKLPLLAPSWPPTVALHNSSNVYAPCPFSICATYTKYYRKSKNKRKPQSTCSTLPGRFRRQVWCTLEILLMTLVRQNWIPDYWYVTNLGVAVLVIWVKGSIQSSARQKPFRAQMDWPELGKTRPH